VSPFDGGADIDPAVWRAILLDQVRDAVIVTDLTGHVILWNRRATAMYGWMADEVVGRHIGELTAGPDQAGPGYQMIDVVTAGGTWDGELTVARKDGSTFDARVSSSLMCDASGAPVGVVAISVDATPMQQAKAEARRQSELTSLVLDALQTSAVILDADGSILAMNKEWTRQAHTNDADRGALGRGVDYLAQCAGDPESETARAIGAGIRKVLADGGQWSIEYPCPDGDTVTWYSCEASGLPGGGCVVLRRDISHVIAERAALERAADENLRLITMVSHEVRTPLTAILGLSEELLTGRDLDPAQITEFHQIIAEQAREVASLVEDLLVVARIDNNTLTVARQEFEALEVVSSVLRPFQLTNGPIGVSMPAYPVSAMGDQTRLRQVLRNLVNNAVRHGAAPIEVDVRLDAGRVVITVADHGPGIDPAQADAVFRPFGRLPTMDSPDSVGIGLSVARALVERMGGSLRYDRADRTEFVVSLESAGTGR
jgi:PAS domain S-box-containing protein